jgi:biotin synthase
MCYAIPGKVLAIQDRTVTVDYFGETKTARNELPAVRVGDYIYAQGGYVIEIVPEQEARSILDAWKETFFALQDVDVTLTRVARDKHGVPDSIVRILDKALEERPLDRSELLQLMGLEKDHELKLLYQTANFLRQKNLSNSCCVHGIVEFSNHCVQQCLYCGISTHNKNVSRYRMSRTEILDAVHEAVEVHGFKALVLQSGEDHGYPVKELCSLLREIKARHAALLFVSCGEVGPEGLQSLYDAGARGLLMRFETSNPVLYEKLRPGCRLETRLEHLKAAYRMGYLILTGGLIGLPGQTRADVLNDILLTKELHAEMYSFGPFLPHPETWSPPALRRCIPGPARTD